LSFVTSIIAAPRPCLVMAPGAAGRTASTPCPSGHCLEEKQVAGTSWFSSCKACSGCRVVLKTGMSRHSCKTCKYHLCTACHTSTTEEWLKKEINITIYRASQPGLDEDAWPISIERGATINSLRSRIAVLYGLAPQMQTFRRDVDSQPLADDDQLGCDEGDVLHLSLAAAGGFMMGPLGIPGMEGLAEALSGAMNEAVQYSQAMQESLDNTAYNLTFVLPAKASVPEKRCRLEVAAMARVQEVLEMVQLELCAEEIASGLEFSGEELPLQAPIHNLGLRDGDIVMVVQLAETTSL